MRSRLPYLLLGSTLLALSMAGDRRSNARITGIIDDPSSTPIAGATVELVSVDGVLRTESGANGSFAFDTIPPGAYEIDIAAPGFAKEKLSSNVQENTALTPLLVRLRFADMETCGPHSSITYGPLGSTHQRIAGMVREMGGPRPVVNAKVMLRQIGDHRAAFRSQTNRTGRFTLEGVPPGYYELRIVRPAYQSVQIRRLIKPRGHDVIIDAEVLRQGIIVICQ